jgi:DNA repair exonuclease SbcCD nuclease subunit
MTILKNSDFNLFVIPYQNPSDVGKGDSVGDIHKSGADLIKGRLKEYKKEKLKDKPTFIIAHISILDSRFANSERIQEGEIMLSVDDLNLDWIDGVMLGHIHNSQQDIFEKTRIRYAGAHYRTRFDEVLEPGFFMWTFNGKMSIDFVEIPARDMVQIIMNEEQTKELIAGKDLDIPPDADVKFIFEVPQGMTKMIDISKINGSDVNSNVEVSLRVNPVTEVRSKEIGKAVTDADKLNEWAKVSGVEITSSIRKKLDEIINHDKGIYT